MDARALEKLLYHESGLLGVSGAPKDFRGLACFAYKSLDLHCKTPVAMPSVFRMMNLVSSRLKFGRESA
jgi:acetate kinase